ncbi:CaiB/BaiF CoA transferase family protein [Yinghuangia seranimata]|uniref:CaiB/BaiF CoA transferase family protein n=1 Tax=Yinghuangia seranimata TaxID=408067 RepID=UPI00248BFE57|nr:CaiB/BaiF CoA-transferase family protein [Yinghuangia seranimata]MDI2126584.1 CaiB/BaiF CoA-transferase family protein [Yinghuangia seranimata]
MAHADHSEEPRSDGPLAGVTVVSLEQAVSAPMCTRTLGDFGARVIKVEHPRGGDFARHYDDVVHGQAAHFVWLNRGKESVALDVKDPGGVAVLHRLLGRADVLVSNLAPGAAGRLGLGRDALAARHPDLIAVEIDGYGAGGPLSGKRAYDLLVQAESGACSITGHPGAPAKPGPPMADVCTGLYGAISVLALLAGRGRGRPVDPTVSVSMFDTMAELMGYALTYTRHTGVDQEPRGMGSPAVAPYGAYPTADGHTVVLGTTNDREWQRLADELLERPGLAADPRYTANADRVRHRDALDEAIAAWCARHKLADIQARADAAGIGNSRYNTPSDVLAHPHLAARGRWQTVATPGGDVPALLPPPVIPGYTPPMGAIPALGEHTAAVLAELGYDDAEIADLRTRGAIG